MPTPNSNTCLLRLERVDDSGGALAISFGIEFEVGGDGVVLAGAGLQCFYREIFELITFWPWISRSQDTKEISRTFVYARVPQRHLSKEPRILRDELTAQSNPTIRSIWIGGQRGAKRIFPAFTRGGKRVAGGSLQLAQTPGSGAVAGGDAGFETAIRDGVLRRAVCAGVDWSGESDWSEGNEME